MFQGGPAASRRLPFDFQVHGGLGRLALGDLAIGPLTIDTLELEVSDLGTDPGAARAERFQRRRTQLGALAVRIAPSGLDERVAHIKSQLADAGITQLSARLADGYVAVRARAADGLAAADLSFHVVLVSAGTQLRALASAIRVHGHLPTPGPVIADRLLVALTGASETRSSDRPSARGLCDVEIDLIGALLWHLLPPSGWRLPAVAGVELSHVRITRAAIEIAYGPAGALAGGSATGSIAHPLAAAHDVMHSADRQLRAGHLEDAMRGYRALLASGGPDQPVLLERILALAAARPAWFADGLELARQALGRWPGFAPAHAALASITLAQGDAREAARHLEDSARKASTSGDDDQAALAALAAARLLRVLDPRAATPLYQLALEHDPTSVEAADSLADRLADEQRWPELVRSLRARIATAEPDRAVRLHLRLAEVLVRQLGDPAGAERELAAARALAPDNPAVHEMTAELLAISDPPGALAAWHEVARLAEQHGDRRTTARAWARIGDWLAAAPPGAPSEPPDDAWRRALELDATQSDALIGLAQTAAARDEHATAVALYERLRGLGLAPLSAARHELALAQSLVALGRSDDARAGLRRATSAGGEPAAEAHAMLAEIADAVADSEHAAAELDIAITSLVEIAAGAPAEGDRLYTRAAELAIERAMLLDRSGQVSAAGADWQRAHALARQAAPEIARDAARTMLARVGDGEGHDAGLERRWIDAVLATRPPPGERAQLLVRRADVRRRERFPDLAAALADLRDAVELTDELPEHGGEATPIRRQAHQLEAELFAQTGDARARARSLAAVAQLTDHAAERVASETAAAAAWLAADEPAAALPHATRAHAQLASTAEVPVGLRRDVLITLGEAAWCERAWPDVIRAYRSLVGDPGAEASRQATFRYRLAVAAERVADHALALEALRPVLDDPEATHGASPELRTHALRLFADLAERTGELAAAATALEQAAAIGGEGTAMARADAVYRAGELFRRTERADDAIRCFETALRISDNHLPALDALEATWRERGDLERVAVILGRKVAATARQPGRQKSLLSRLGDLQDQLGRPEVALATHQRALEIDPLWRPSLRYVTLRLRDTGQLVAAAGGLAQLAGDLHGDHGDDPAAVFRERQVAAQALGELIAELADAQLDAVRAVALPALERLAASGADVAAGMARLRGEPSAGVVASPRSEADTKSDRVAGPHGGALTLREAAGRARAAGRLDQAFATLETANHVAPGDPGVLRDLVDIAIELGDPTSAARHLTSLAGALAGARRGDALLELADIYYDQIDDAARGREAMRQAAEAFGSGSRRDATLRLLATEAATHLAWDIAVESLLAVPVEKRTPADMMSLTNALLRAGRDADALAIVQLAMVAGRFDDAGELLGHIQHEIARKTELVRSLEDRAATAPADEVAELLAEAQQLRIAIGQPGNEPLTDAAVPEGESPRMDTAPWPMRTKTRPGVPYRQVAPAPAGGRLPATLHPAIRATSERTGWARSPTLRLPAAAPFGRAPAPVSNPDLAGDEPAGTSDTGARIDSERAARSVGSSPGIAVPAGSEPRDGSDADAAPPPVADTTETPPVFAGHDADVESRASGDRASAQRTPASPAEDPAAPAGLAELASADRINPARSGVPAAPSPTDLAAADLAPAAASAAAPTAFHRPARSTVLSDITVTDLAATSASAPDFVAAPQPAAAIARAAPGLARAASATPAGAGTPADHEPRPAGDAETSGEWQSVTHPGLRSGPWQPGESRARRASRPTPSRDPGATAEREPAPPRGEPAPDASASLVSDPAERVAPPRASLDPTGPRASLDLTAPHASLDPGLPRASLDPTLPRASLDPTLPRASLDPTLPRASLDPTTPRASLDPPLPLTSLDPTLPRASLDPTAPRASLDPALPLISLDPTLPRASLDPPLPLTSLDPTAPRASLDPLAARASLDPAAPRASLDPTLPRTSLDPTLPRASLDPARPLTSLDPAFPLTSLDPARPLTSLDPARPLTSLDPTAPRASLDPALPLTSLDPTLPRASLDRELAASSRGEHTAELHAVAADERVAAAWLDAALASTEPSVRIDAALATEPAEPAHDDAPSPPVERSAPELSAVEPSGQSDASPAAEPASSVGGATGRSAGAAPVIDGPPAPARPEAPAAAVEPPAASRSESPAPGPPAELGAAPVAGDPARPAAEATPRLDVRAVADAPPAWVDRPLPPVPPPPRPLIDSAPAAAPPVAPAPAPPVAPAPASAAAPPAPASAAAPPAPAAAPPSPVPAAEIAPDRARPSVTIAGTPEETALALLLAAASADRERLFAARRADPDDPGLLLALLAHLGNREPAVRRELLEEAARTSHGRALAIALHELAVLARENREALRATAMWIRAYETDPTYEPVWMPLADAYAASDDFAAARDLYEAIAGSEAYDATRRAFATERAESLGRDDAIVSGEIAPRGSSGLEEADQLAASEDWSGAIGAAERAAAARPDDLKVLETLERIYYASGNVAAASEVIGRQLMRIDDLAVRARLWRRRARMFRDALGRDAEAYRCLKEAHACSPADPEIAYQLRTAAMVRGEWQLAASLMYREIAVAGNPRDRGALHLELAMIYDERLDDAAQAQTHYEQALAFDPTIPAVKLPLARRYEAIGRSSDAARLYEDAAGHARPADRAGLLEAAVRCREAAAQSSEPDLAAQLDRAEAAGDRDAALDLANQLWRAEPGHPAAFRTLANTYRSSGDLAALTELTSVRTTRAETADERATAWLEVARLAEEVGALDQAARSYDLALIEDPGHAGALDARGALAFRLADFATADLIYRDLGSGESVLGDDELALRRSIIAEQLGRDGDALQLAQLAARLAPGRRDLIGRVQELATRVGDRTVALAAARNTLELTPLDDDEAQLAVQFSLVELLREADQLDEAVVHLEKILRDHPMHAQALEALAHVHAARGDWPAATRYLHQLVPLAPSPGHRAERLYQLGEAVLLHVHDVDRADDAFLRASDLDPAHVPTLRRLLDVYWRADDPGGIVEVATELADKGALIHGPTSELALARALIAAALVGDAALAQQLQVALGEATPQKIADALTELTGRSGRLQLGSASTALAELARRGVLDLAKLRAAAAGTPIEHALA